MALDFKDIPELGFGLWKIDKDICADVVYQAIEAGYRHFDSAADYGNEKEVGQGLKRAINDGLVKREELWVTSKLWNTYHRKEHVQPALEKTLEDLQIDYLDLYLIHFPIALKFVPFEKRYPPEWLYDPEADDAHMEIDDAPLHETWAAMEDLVKAGLVNNIGVCNYNTNLIHDLMRYATIKPSMVQVELHPYLTQEKLLKLCAYYSIKVTGFSPLGALSYVPLEMADKEESLLDHAIIKTISRHHQKTPAQILLRWGIQRGTCLIPKTVKQRRMKENLDIFDFSLSDGEMKSISDLNKNRRFNDPGVFCEAAFNTFYPIYE